MDTSPALQLGYRIPSGHVIVANWGAEISVYCRRTGETHLLSVLPAEILGTLSTNATGLDCISTHLAEVCGQHDTPEWADRIMAMLDELVNLELVERYPA